MPVLVGTPPCKQITESRRTEIRGGLVHPQNHSTYNTFVTSRFANYLDPDEINTRTQTRLFVGTRLGRTRGRSNVIGIIAVLSHEFRVAPAWLRRSRYFSQIKGAPDIALGNSLFASPTRFTSALSRFIQGTHDELAFGFTKCVGGSI